MGGSWRSCNYASLKVSLREGGGEGVCVCVCVWEGGSYLLMCNNGMMVHDELMKNTVGNVIMYMGVM